MIRKALVVYASVTGNTEKVARRFQQVFEKKGRAWGDWECDIFKVTKNTYKENVPYSFQDYDFTCVGGPIWAGIPPLYLFDDHLGALSKMMRPSGMGPGGPGNQGEPPPMPEGGMPFGRGPAGGTRKSIVFVTYGGQGSGPAECLASLEVLSLFSGGKVAGKFACCGGMWDEPPIDVVANRFGWMVGDATVAVDAYRANPDDPQFAKLTPEDRKVFEKAVKDTEKFKTGLDDAKRIAPMMRSWHYDYEHRPIERDLLKAEIFLEEILEDYYWGGIEKDPVYPNICIA